MLCNANIKLASSCKLSPWRVSFHLHSCSSGRQGSHRLEPQREEDSRKWEGSADRKQEVGPTRVSHTLQSAENVSVKLMITSAWERKPWLNEKKQSVDKGVNGRAVVLCFLRHCISRGM